MQAPPTPPAAKFTQHAPSTENQVQEVTSTEPNSDGVPSQKKKKARRGKKKKAILNAPDTSQDSEDTITSSANTTDESNKSTGTTNVWFHKNIENVKKATPTKAPPKLSSSKPKQPPPKANTTNNNNKAATSPATASPQLESKSTPSPAKTSTIRYSDILKAPPPKVRHQRAKN